MYTDKTKKLNTSFIAYNNENENIELKTSKSVPKDKIQIKVRYDADNVKDRVDRDRSACGEYNGRSKLTNEAVVEIFKDNNTSKCALAKKYNVDEKTIRKIKNRTTWKKATMFI